MELINDIFLWNFDKYYRLACKPSFQGQPVEYVNQDENSRRWLAEFRTKAFAIPTSLQSIDRKD